MAITLIVTDSEFDSADVNHRGSSVFDKSSDEELSEMLCDEYPVLTKQKKTCEKKEGGRLTTAGNNYS